MVVKALEVKRRSQCIMGSSPAALAYSRITHGSGPPDPPPTITFIKKAVVLAVTFKHYQQ